MPIVINVTDETISGRIAGNWFTWAPRQQKTIRDERIAKKIAGHHELSEFAGLAVMPDIMTEEERDGNAPITDEEMTRRKKEFEESKKVACEAAMERYIRKLRFLVKNNQVSQQKDIDQSGAKYNASADITKGEMEAMRLLAKYQRKSADEADERAKEVEKLKEVIGMK
jgi:hypothetical protein